MSKIRQPSKNDSFLDVNDLRTGVNFIQAKSKLSQQQLEEKFASSGRIEIDGGLSISYDDIEYSLDKRTGDTIITFKKSVSIKSPINGSTTAPLDFDIFSKKKKTIFNEDNSIDTITDNEKLTTVFNDDGSITETYESVNGAKYKKTTVFNEDGSIDENVETISEANNINIDENFYRVNGYEIVDLDGKPFHMVAIKRSLTSNYLSEEKLNKLFQEISEDGFNTLITSFLPKRDIIYYPNIFKYAEKYGVKLVVELYYYDNLLKDDEAMRLNLEQIRNNRNVVMVSIYDAYSQKDIEAAIAKIREIDAHHAIMVRARDGYEYEDKNLVFYDDNSDKSFTDFTHGYENVSYYDFIVSEMDEKTKSSNTSNIETINRHRSTWTHAVSSPISCEDIKVYSGIVAFTLQNYSEGTEIKFRNLKVYDVATGETISNFDFNKAYCYNAEKSIDSDGSLKVVASGTGDIAIYMGDMSVTNSNGTFRAQVGKNYRIEFDYCDNDSIKDPQVTINYLTKFIGFNYIFPLRDYFEYYFSEIINRMKTLNVPIIPNNINCDFDVMMERGEDFFWDITKTMYSTGANVIYDVYNELMYDNSGTIHQGLYTIIFNALHQSTKYTRVFLDEESAIAGSADENSYIIGITSKEAVPIVKNVVINDNAASTKSTYSSSKIENVIKDISKKLINNEEISSAISQKVSDEIDKNLGSIMDRLNAINNGTTPIIGSGINIIRKSKAEYDALSESEKNNGSLYYVYDEDEVLSNGESFIKELTSAQYEALTDSEKQANVLYLVGNDLYFKNKVLNGNSENEGTVITPSDEDMRLLTNSVGELEIPRDAIYLKFLPFDEIDHEKMIDFFSVKLRISMGIFIDFISYLMRLFVSTGKISSHNMIARSEVEESLNHFENEFGYNFNKYLEFFTGKNFDYAYLAEGGEFTMDIEPGDELSEFVMHEIASTTSNKAQLKGAIFSFLDENKNLIKEVPFIMPYDDNHEYLKDISVLTSENYKEYFEKATKEDIIEIINSFSAQEKTELFGNTSSEINFDEIDIDELRNRLNIPEGSSTREEIIMPPAITNAGVIPCLNQNYFYWTNPNGFADSVDEEHSSLDKYPYNLTPKNEMINTIKGICIVETNDSEIISDIDKDKIISLGFISKYYRTYSTFQDTTLEKQLKYKTYGFFAFNEKMINLNNQLHFDEGDYKLIKFSIVPNVSFALDKVGVKNNDGKEYWLQSRDVPSSMFFTKKIQNNEEVYVAFDKSRFNQPFEPSWPDYYKYDIYAIVPKNGYDIQLSKKPSYRLNSLYKKNGNEDVIMQSDSYCKIDDYWRFHLDHNTEGQTIFYKPDNAIFYFTNKEIFDANTYYIMIGRFAGDAYMENAYGLYLGNYKNDSVTHSIITKKTYDFANVKKVHLIYKIIPTSQDQKNNLYDEMQATAFIGNNIETNHIKEIDLKELGYRTPDDNEYASGKLYDAEIDVQEIDSGKIGLSVTRGRIILVAIMLEKFSAEDEIEKVYLFNEGDTCDEITGGWTKKFRGAIRNITHGEDLTTEQSQNVVYAEGQLGVIEDGKIHLHAETDIQSSLATNNPLDWHGVLALKIKYYTSNSSIPVCCVSEHNRVVTNNTYGEYITPYMLLGNVTGSATIVPDYSPNPNLENSLEPTIKTFVGNINDIDSWNYGREAHLAFIAGNAERYKNDANTYEGDVYISQVWVEKKKLITN